MRWLVLWLLFCGVAAAHQIAEIPMRLTVEDGRVTARAEVDAAYMLPEFRGDEDEDPKDLAWLREQGPAGWEAIARETEAYWRACFLLAVDGRELPWTLRLPALESDAPGFLTEGEGEVLPFLEAVIEAELPPGPWKLETTWKEPFGVNLILTLEADGAIETRPLVSGERAVIATRSAGDAVRPVATDAGDWVKLGFIHILPRGVDHILFVVGLFLLVPRWKPLLQQTVVFTLAHSLSLAAAALGWVNFPATPVEILIAASIAWVGIENLIRKEMGKGRLVLVGVFGLVHGLGFAGVLAELLAASRPEQVPAALLGFNVGLELGQIAVLAVAFASFAWWKEDAFRKLRVGGSILVALAGLILVAERCF